MQIHHIAIVVKNAEASAPFYEKALGLKRIARPTEGMNSSDGAWFQLGDVQLHLQQRSGSEEKSAQHFAIVTNDFERLLSLVPEFGGRVEEGKTMEGFSKRCFIYDPDKNRIEVLKR